MMLVLRCRLSVVLIALATGACRGPGVAESATTVSFSRDLVPVLERQCAACHLTGQEPGMMALHSGAAYASLVGRDSVEGPLKRVEQSEPDRSYLIMKLEGTHLDSGGTGVRMPLGAPPLSAEFIQLFRTWVLEGARDN